MKTTTLAIDIAKEIFYIYGVDAKNNVTIDKFIGRKKLISFIANHSNLKIFMEACAGSNYLCQKFNKMGHIAKRISAQHVRPYVGRQKNDRNDAKAILEASRRPEALFVPIKEVWQQDLQCLYKIRDQKVKQYKATINQVRGLLFEYGEVIPKSITKFQVKIPEVLENAELNLSPFIRDQILDLFENFRKIYISVKQLEVNIKNICKDNTFYKVSQKELRGVGPLTAAKFLSVIGHHSSYKNGRQVSASLGLIPRQYSSGGKTQLGGITKTGNSSLRTLLYLGASATIASIAKKKNLSSEELKLKKQVKEKGHKKVAISLANKNVRQMYAIMKKCS